MPLDNAQFIAELSVVDPPGTDPLNQGDDHIRTTKLAVQQSFPNVGSAVPQTGAQMAQMAIKNELNTFTRTITIDTGGAEVAIAAVGKVEIAAQNTASTARLEFQDLAKTVRWRLEKVQESIASDLRLQRFDASGVFVDAPLTVSESGGNFNFLNRTDTEANWRVYGVTGGARGYQFQDENRINRLWDIVLNQSTLALNIRRFVGGVQQIAPMSIANSSGFIEFSFLIQIKAPDNANSAILDWRKEDGSLAYRFQKEPSNSPDGGSIFFERFSSAGVFQDRPFKLMNDGTIRMESLPTSAPATPSTLWRSSDFIAITPD